MKHFFYTESEYKDGWECDFIRDEDPKWIDLYVSEFCKYLYDFRDGWEWMKDSPEKIIVVNELGEIRYFNFALDLEPSFYVSEVK